MLAAALGISHRYPSSATTLLWRIAAVTSGVNSSSWDVPKYDRKVRFASGVVSTMTVPVDQLHAFRRSQQAY